MRISGVSVGKVQKIELSPDGKHALATLELNDTYGPIPADTKAILRQKTLLGETYVELTPGDPDGPKLRRRRHASQRPGVRRRCSWTRSSAPSTPKTRLAFQQWMQNAAIALRGQGRALSDAFAELEPTFTDADRVLRVLDTQDNAVRQLLANGGTTFEALSERQGQLSGLIRNADQRVHDDRATQPRAAGDLHCLPDLPRPVAGDADAAAALRRQHRPADAAAASGGARADAGRPRPRQLLATELDGFFIGLRPVVAGARRAFPALRRLLVADFPPLLNGLPPFLKQLNPLLETASMYKRELTAFVGNASSAINAVGAGVETNGTPVKYLRVVAPLAPDVLAGFSNRLSSNRTNPYLQPRRLFQRGERGTAVLRDRAVRRRTGDHRAA